jgi:hypothetical protein
MFQYVCPSLIIRLHSMHAAPTPVEECRFPPTFAECRSTTALVSRILPTSSLNNAAPLATFADFGRLPSTFADSEPFHTLHRDGMVLYVQQSEKACQWKNTTANAWTN